MNGKQQRIQIRHKNDDPHDAVVDVFLRSSILVVLEVEVFGEGPVDELGEEDLAAAVLVDRLELCNS